MPSQTDKNKTPVIAVENLFFSYRTTSVLSRVSFRIEEGEFIGIIGPNGGGKTTLLKLLTGFLKPDSGTISVFGKTPVLRSGDSIGLAYVPQAMRFDKDFPISVEEVVLSGLLSRLPWYGKFQASDRAEAKQALEEVGLADFAQSAFGTLSGGQAQRVLVARALVSRPKILLLDEPTAGVDTQAEADIYAILKKLKGKITILMVTHDLNAAVDHVERILCVQGHVFSLLPREICEHFSLGLYHHPLVALRSVSANSSFT